MNGPHLLQELCWGNLVLFCSIGSRHVLDRGGETRLKCPLAGKSSDAQVRVRVTELCVFRAKNKGVRKKNGP